MGEFAFLRPAFYQKELYLSICFVFQLQVEQQDHIRLKFKIQIKYLLAALFTQCENNRDE